MICLKNRSISYLNGRSGLSNQSPYNFNNIYIEIGTLADSKKYRYGEESVKVTNTKAFDWIP